MLAKQKDEYYLFIIELFSSLDIKLSDSDVFQIKLNINLEIMKNILSEVASLSERSDKAQKLKSLANTHYKLNFKVDQKESTIWKKEEIFALQKAVKKFPVGSKNRWERIGDLVKTKPQSQIIQFAHYITTNPTLKIEQDIDINVVLGKKSSSTQLGQSNSTNNSTTTSTPSTPNTNSTPSTPSTNSTTSPTSSITSTTSNETSEDVWSEEQQRGLEQALKTYPSTLPANDRWTKIASDVQGKTKKQCVDRYKFLSSLLKNK